ncbi:Alpha/Beta hydrolase protein [Gongronella butleri]|nr:Alpha/Beta hydrolase protein [Gongronella butleri]
MFFSKFAITGLVTLAASLVTAQDWQQHVLHPAPGANDFRVLASNAFGSHQVRLKKPTTCEKGVQYSGYIDNLEKDDHYFFLFYEARKAPETAPTLLWLNGGPGCSSMMGGAWMELGPCLVNEEGNGTTYNKHAWNEVANLIFLDQPVDVGYSHGKSKIRNTVQSAQDVYAFLRIFFEEFPQYAQQGFHISGESYAGHYLPAIAEEIINQNKFADEEGRFRIPFESVAIGNGWTDPLIQFKYYKDFACATNDSVYQPVFDENTCQQLEKRYPRCERLAKVCYKFPSPLTCVPASLYCEKYTGGDDFEKTGLNVYDIRKKCEGDSGLCYNIMEAIDRYANLPSVKEDLGVDPATGNFTGCTDSVGTRFALDGDNAKNFAPAVAKTLHEGIRVLLYVGDKDFICNWMGNKAWSLSLDWAGKEGFNLAKDQPWTNKDTGKQAGDVRKYKNLSFVKVFDAGHMVPYDQPENSLDLITRWLSDASFSESA